MMNSLIHTTASEDGTLGARDVLRVRCQDVPTTQPQHEVHRVGVRAGALSVTKVLMQDRCTRELCA